MNQSIVAESIQTELDAVHAHDQVKPVCVPFYTLGTEIVSKLPPTNGTVLVISDLGLLVAVLRKYKSEQVTFVAHTPEQEAFSQNLAVKTWQVGYNDPIKHLEKLCMGLKFDIIVGNPPYQDPSQPAGKLWARFILAVVPYLSDRGSLAFVTPVMWLTASLPSANKLREKLKKAGLGLKWADLDVDNSFSVAEKICAFILQRGHLLVPVLKNAHPIESYDWQPLLRASEDPLRRSVQNKVLAAGPKIKPVAWNASSLEALPDIAYEMSAAHPNPVMYTASKMVYTSADTSEFQGPKVLINCSGHYKKDPKYIRVSDVEVAGKGALQVNFETQKQAINAHSYLTSKLIVYFVSINKSGGFNHGSVVQIPAVDFSRAWSDAEVYAHFDLTQDEIDLVERSMK